MSKEESCVQNMVFKGNKQSTEFKNLPQIPFHDGQIKIIIILISWLFVPLKHHILYARLFLAHFLNKSHIEKRENNNNKNKTERIILFLFNGNTFDNGKHSASLKKTSNLTMTIRKNSHINNTTTNKIANKQHKNKESI